MKKRFVQRSAMAGGVLLLLLLGFLCYKPSLLEDYSFSRRLSDRHGEILRLTISQDEKYRIFTPLSEYSDTLKEAVLLKEDKHFYSHFGVNPLAAFRAFVSTYLSQGKRMGGSTISMQLARLRFGLHTRTVPGKLWQMLRAFQLELHYSKDQLLEAYLNLAPYGYNVEGVGAASLIFFHKDSKELTLPESLALAVLPQNPARRKFARGMTNSESLQRSRQALFEEWVELHPEAEQYRGILTLPVMTFGREDLRFAAPHLTETLLREHPEQAHIKTTLDLSLQTVVERILSRNVLSMRNVGITNAAALLVDAPTMEVVASVGSVNFFDESIHGQIDGTRMKRSPGSAMKPFLYGLAFEQGLVHPLSMIADTPMSFGAYDPENFDRKFLGPVSAKDALRLSRNVPAMRLAMRLKSPNLYDFLQSADIRQLRPEREYGLSLVLGGAEVTMRELAELYALLANGGKKRSLRYRRDEQQEEGEKTLLSREASFLTLDSLRSTPRPEIRVGGPEVYWKTGTSNGFHDAWTAGIFGRYVLVVWIGDFTGASNPSFVGIRTAAPLFFSIVHALSGPETREDLVETLRRSARVESVDVCAPTGDLYDPLCPVKAKAWFIPGVSPIRKQDVFRRVLVNRETGMRACRYEEGITDWKIFEFWPSDLREAFEKTGIRKASLPDIEADCAEEEFSNTGHAPSISSPQPNVEYQLRLSAGDNEKIPFLAVADADVKSLHWFLGKTYLGETSPSEPFYWKPVPGNHVVRVVDDHGRSDTSKVSVGIAQ